MLPPKLNSRVKPIHICVLTYLRSFEIQSFSENLQNVFVNEQLKYLESRHLDFLT